MVGFVIVELSLLAAMWAIFIVVHAWAGAWRSWVDRQLIAMAAVGMIEALALVALGTGHVLPVWVYAVVFGVTDLVVAGWLILMWKARSSQPPSENSGPGL